MVCGKKVEYKPGWDCHGLPIEWKVEEEWRKQNKNPRDDVAGFRQACRDYADKWQKTQLNEFKRLGINANWDNPYTTMDFKSEARIVGELHSAVMKGLIYSADRPVMWSPVEKTSLAEAEVEYKTVTTTSAYVAFNITSDNYCYGEKVIIWTTTPWTLPGNEAVAFSHDAVYAVVKHQGVDYLVGCNQDCIPMVPDSWEKWELVQTLMGCNLGNLTVTNPFGKTVPVIAADFVTMDTGTGFVHIAPGHGKDDFALGKSHNLPIYSVVDDNGCMTNSPDGINGVHVYKASDAVIALLGDAVVATKQITHEYPHSWRSKKPVIFKTTPQWFMKIDPIRDAALSAASEVEYYPASGRNRLVSMIESRYDWCLSRQRMWGVPMMLLVHDNGTVLGNETGQFYASRAHEFHEWVYRRVEEEGCDWWLITSVEEITKQFDASTGGGWFTRGEVFTKVTDVLDVWFDSGCVHTFTPNQIADVYIEGTDQHRGWFQSSLLELVATRARAPFKALVTHGFVMADKGVKMSKSEGNVTHPSYVIDKYGADVLRMWVACSDYQNDLVINETVLTRTQDMFLRIRNTFRFLLGNIGSDHQGELVYDDLPNLEKYVLHELVNTHSAVTEAMDAYNFNAAFRAAFHFCDTTLSSFYFDVRKDSLYCDSKNSTKRNMTIQTMIVVLKTLCQWFAPVIPFTVQEVHQHYNCNTNWMVFPNQWNNSEIATVFVTILNVRRQVLAEIERKRKPKAERGPDDIGSSLDASLIFKVGTEDMKSALSSVDMAEICITSHAGIHYQPGMSFDVVVNHAKGEVCDRCRQYHVHLTNQLCDRCHTAEKGE